MRKVRYEVAVSLDGFIAGPNGEYDWIPTDPEMDFAALYDQFDTIFVGRRTFELFHTMMPKKETFVFSRTLQATQYPDVTIVHENLEAVVTELLTKPGKDIWLACRKREIAERLRPIKPASQRPLPYQQVLLRAGSEKASHHRITKYLSPVW